MADVKKPTTYQEQISILKERHVIIADDVICEKRLSEINYYRLAAYFLPFRSMDGGYLPSTDFDRVFRIYEFDRKMRSLLFSAIEEVEVFLRAKLSYFHAHRYGALGYMDDTGFSSRHDAQRFHENIAREIKNNDKALFVKHHLQHYNGDFPVWVIVELFSFGMLSRFYADMLTPDKKALARSLYGTTPKNMESWLRCITDLRNICAHYGRLYYRIFTAVPAGTVHMPERSRRRLWGAVSALKMLYPDAEKWNNEILINMTALFEEYQADIDLYHIAFPQNWTDELKR